MGDFLFLQGFFKVMFELATTVSLNAGDKKIEVVDTVKELWSAYRKETAKARLSNCCSVAARKAFEQLSSSQWGKACLNTRLLQVSTAESGYYPTPMGFSGV